MAAILQQIVQLAGKKQKMLIEPRLS